MAWRPLADPPSHPLPPLLPPQPIDAPSKQGAYLKQVFSESRSVLDSDPCDDAAGWQLVERRKGFSVYKREVEQGKQLTMSRLEVEVPVPPDQLFELLAHPRRALHRGPIPSGAPRRVCAGAAHAAAGMHRLCRAHSCRHPSAPHKVQELRMPLPGDAKVVYSEAPRFWGLLRPREYVTCDAAATKERLFVCKSCEVPEGPLATPKKGMVRANLLYAMRMKEVPGQPGRTRMQCINWLDLGRDTVPTWLANAVTERWFFPALVKRLKRYTEQHGLAAPGAWAA
ncbi:hypothetical protein COHA_010309 [Chlorella ohadii]|uniref:START domain-containing protein n=1 Tax=Chlorella ohadii TaxID=2649997 RepID=A0AAD5GXB5_9CHLO|nr:hypothetical protein COHA_010309 [Chlorella ohadii]